MENKINPPIPDMSIQELLTNGVSKNCELPCDLLTHLMSGSATCGFIGRAGTGKLSVMRSVLRHTDPIITLSITDEDDELFRLRETYPTRNVLIISKSDFLNATITSDVLIKREPSIMVIREGCSDEVVYQMVTRHKGAYDSTLFTHYAHTPKDLVRCLSETVFSMGGFEHTTEVEKLVVEFLDYIVIMSRNSSGVRYIERITEITPKADVTEQSGVLTEYTYNIRDIIRYNSETNTYVTINPLSDALVSKLLSRMDAAKAGDFKQFLTTNF